MIKAIVFDLQGTLVENGVYPSPLKQTKYILRVNMPFAEYVPAFEKVFMTKKYAIHLPLDKKLPVMLIKKLLRARMRFNDEIKKNAKKKI